MWGNSDMLLAGVQIGARTLESHLAMSREVEAVQICRAYVAGVLAWMYIYIYTHARESLHMHTAIHRYKRAHYSDVYNSKTLEACSVSINM